MCDVADIGDRTTHPPLRTAPRKGAVSRLEYVLPVDDEDVRAESQKEWANWSAHGYRKPYQPRSVLWLGGIFTALLIVLLLLCSPDVSARTTKGRRTGPS